MDYGNLSHFPGKGHRRSRLENLITKLLKKQMSKNKHNRAIMRTVHSLGLINKRCDRLKDSVQVNGGHFKR